MTASLTRRLATTAFVTLAALGAGMASAETTDGSDFHPLLMNSPTNAQVQAGAIAAAHPTGTESVGQSTAMPMPTSNVSPDEVYRGAVQASHPTGTESIGQSTAMPRVQSATGS